MGLAPVMRATIAVLLALPVLYGHARVAQAADTAAITYRDCAECPEIVVIPAGEFVMGASADEESQE